MSQKRRAPKAASVETSPKSTDKGRDLSPKVPQRDKIDFQLSIREREDLTEKQKIILETMLHKDTRCVMIDGIWGSAKSWTAALASLKLLNSGRVKSILYVRNPVEASQHSKVGYLSGDLNQKIAPYTAVLQEKLEELLPAADINRLFKDERIQCIPTGFIQGRSYNCAAIIVDECASMSWEDLMLIISRCGPFTRIFFLGDTINQVYLSEKSGFKRFFQAFDDMESKEHGIYTFELKESQDIVRSSFVRFVMEKTGMIRRASNTQVSSEPMFPPK